MSYQQSEYPNEQPPQYVRQPVTQGQQPQYVQQPQYPNEQSPQYVQQPVTQGQQSLQYAQQPENAASPIMVIQPPTPSIPPHQSSNIKKSSSKVSENYYIKSKHKAFCGLFAYITALSINTAIIIFFLIFIFGFSNNIIELFNYVNFKLFDQLLEEIGINFNLLDKYLYNSEEIASDNKISIFGQYEIENTNAMIKTVLILLGFGSVSSLIGLVIGWFLK